MRLDGFHNNRLDRRTAAPQHHRAVHSFAAGHAAMQLLQRRRRRRRRRRTLRCMRAAARRACMHGRRLHARRRRHPGGNLAAWRRWFTAGAAAAACQLVLPLRAAHHLLAARCIAAMHACMQRVYIAAVSSRRSSRLAAWHFVCVHLLGCNCWWHAAACVAGYRYLNRAKAPKAQTQHALSAPQL